MGDNDVNELVRQQQLQNLELLRFYTLHSQSGQHSNQQRAQRLGLTPPTTTALFVNFDQRFCFLFAARRWNLLSCLLLSRRLSETDLASQSHFSLRLYPAALAAPPWTPPRNSSK